MEFANIHLLEDKYSNISDEIIGGVVGAIGNVVSSTVTAAKKSDAKAQAEATCGKQPHGFLGIKGAKKKKLIKEWNDCVKTNTLNTQNAQRLELQSQIKNTQQAGETEKEKTKRIQSILIWSSVSVAFLTVIIIGGIIILKKKQK